jgi:hypothetical protein
VGRRDARAMNTECIGLGRDFATPATSERVSQNGLSWQRAGGCNVFGSIPLLRSAVAMIDRTLSCRTRRPTFPRHSDDILNVDATPHRTAGAGVF